jgi:hypothetical protein
MRILLAALLAIAGITAAQAQVSVERADVVRRGLYTIGKFDAIKDDAISTGQRTSANKITFKSSTARITAKDGVVFGLDVFIHGAPKGSTIPMRVVWRYPEPGLRNPGTGKVKIRDEYTDEKALNAESTYYWSLGDAWTQVPGEWTFELWYRDRMLVSETFTVVK